MRKDPTKTQWGRVIAGAFLLEIALIALFIPLFALIGQAPVLPFVPIGVLVLGFLFGWWVGRNVRSRPVLHATLTGIVATVIYIVLCLAQPGGIASVVEMYGPFQFVLGNGVRILGCAVGGFVGRPR